MYIYEMIEKKKSMITMLTSWIYFYSKIFIFFSNNKRCSQLVYKCWNLIALSSSRTPNLEKKKKTCLKKV